MFSKGIYMEDKRIETIKQWPEFKSVWEIQVFFRFAKFYWQFIQRFNWIAAPLTLILKNLSTELDKLEKGRVKLNSENRDRHDGSELDRDNIDNGEVKDNEIKKKIQKTFMSKYLSQSKQDDKNGLFFPKARLAFTKLRWAFFKVLILYHFDPECYIRVEIDASCCVIGEVFIKKRLLVPDLVTCYSKDAQRELIKLRRSRE